MTRRFVTYHFDLDVTVDVEQAVDEDGVLLRDDVLADALLDRLCQLTDEDIPAWLSSFDGIEPIGGD